VIVHSLLCSTPLHLPDAKLCSCLQGAAVIQFLQSTGHALSPMVDRIATALDDEPSRKAAIRCATIWNTLKATDVSKQVGCGCSVAQHQLCHQCCLL
jgi:hypothetical protein